MGSDGLPNTLRRMLSLLLRRTRSVIAHDPPSRPTRFARRLLRSWRGPAKATDSCVPELSAYERWLKEFKPDPVSIECGPRISVIIPTWNTPEPFLREAIASVKMQTYSSWELCMADDASQEGHVINVLRSEADRDPRIRFVVRTTRGGISAASNDALALASGEYVAFLDHDDILSSEALAAVAANIVATNADVIYTDHDYLSQDGRRRNPFFKPDWSPDLLLAQMYLAHLIVFRKAFLSSLGSLRSEFDGSQDYDVVLRSMLAGARIEHVPRVLYHWREHSGSTAGNHASKPYAHDAGRRAIQSYLAVAHPGAWVDVGSHVFCYDVRYPLPDPPPLVSVIIPTKDRVDLLSSCIESILRRTDYERFEILVIDNGSVEPATRDWLQDIARQDHRVRVHPVPIPFNWSRLNNLAAKEAKGDVLIFLNNDTEVLSPDWMLRLSENTLRPGIGVAGPLLLYADGTIQHAGVVLGLGGWADHVFKGLPAVHRQHLFVSPVLRRNVLAVTGACMAVSADTFQRLGGFDDSFTVCGSDVEICLRAHRMGLRNVYLPEARLIHHESRSRDAAKIPDEDFRRSAAEYGDFRTEGDLLYNPNLDPRSAIPELRGPL